MEASQDLRDSVADLRVQVDFLQESRAQSSVVDSIWDSLCTMTPQESMVLEKMAELWPVAASTAANAIEGYALVEPHTTKATRAVSTLKPKPLIL